MSKSIIEKIWDSHIVSQNQGHPAIFAVDFMLMHEVTSAQAFDMLRSRNLKVFDPSKCLATLDHAIPTRQNRLQIFDDSARNQVETLRKNCADFGIQIMDFDSGSQGIVHVIGPELGITQPGMTIVCGDSHTSTHGAFGALAFGIGTSEVGHVLASGCLLQTKPKTMRIKFKGKMQKGVFSKDLILKLISEIGVGGATSHVILYAGECIDRMSMAERMTICNMSIECGARAGLMEPDETTYAWIKGKKHAPKDFEKAVAYWNSLRSNADAKFDREIEIDIDNLKPMVTWGTNPGQGIQIDQVIPDLETLPTSERSSALKALEYIGLNPGQKIAGTKIDWAFIGSCTNGRIEDLRLAAQVLKDKKIAEGVTCYIIPGSEAVRAQAIAEGLDRIFIEAGADFRMPGCSMCLGMNDDKVPNGQRCISSSNRNFMGRQGPGSRTHLASPVTVAASAIEGQITSGLNYL
jgi:3-isopropylmalate/(R)-2-methylmalate dehydratase large subunit